MKSTPETVQIWAVGQKLWLRDYPGIYEALKKEWSENISQIMEAVKGICKPLLCCLIYILLQMQTQVHISSTSISSLVYIWHSTGSQRGKS